MENMIYLCQKCKSFIKSNLEKDIKSEEFYKLFKIKENNNCQFCFGSLNNNYSNLISQIGEKIKEYEYLHLNIQTRFSCLFSIFHLLLINKLLQNNNKNKEIIEGIIKTSEIRKLFKEIFSPNFKNQLNLKIEIEQGDMIIIISFNFKRYIYDEFNKIFSEYIQLQKENNNLEPINPEDDNSKIRHYLALLKDESLNEKFIQQLNKIFTSEILSNNFYLDYKVTIAPFYIFGHYIKLDREMGQVPYIKDGIKLSLSSIDEELKGFLKKIFMNNEEDLIFSAGGREDRDVRMLGNGRAFIYSVFNAKKHYSLDFNKINKDLNNTLKKIKVNGLRICDKKNFQVLKKAENEKIKIYTAFIWSKEEITQEKCQKIENVKDLLVNQITPLRVLHKRVLKVREKYIYGLKIKEKINPHFMIIEIKSSAGTYIKEFVNGDLGRTYPSVGDIIGNECDIIQLDVQDIII